MGHLVKHERDPNRPRTGFNQKNRQRNFYSHVLSRLKTEVPSTAGSPAQSTSPDTVMKVGDKGTSRFPRLDSRDARKEACLTPIETHNVHPPITSPTLPDEAFMRGRAHDLTDRYSVR